MLLCVARSVYLSHCDSTARAMLCAQVVLCTGLLSQSGCLGVPAAAWKRNDECKLGSSWCITAPVNSTSVLHYSGVCITGLMAAHMLHLALLMCLDARQTTLALLADLPCPVVYLCNHT